MATDVAELSVQFSTTFSADVDVNFDAYGRLIFLIGQRCVCCTSPYLAVSCEQSCPANTTPRTCMNYIPYVAICRMSQVRHGM